MTHEQLAKRAKVSGSYLVAIEAGYRKNQSLDVLRHLAKALGVPGRSCWDERVHC